MAWLRIALRDFGWRQGFVGKARAWTTPSSKAFEGCDATYAAHSALRPGTGAGSEAHSSAARRTYLAGSAQDNEQATSKQARALRHTGNGVGFAAKAEKALSNVVARCRIGRASE